MNGGRYIVAIDEAQREMEGMSVVWNDEVGRAFLSTGVGVIAECAGRLAMFEDEMISEANEAAASIPLEDMNNLVRNACEMAERL